MRVSEVDRLQQQLSEMGERLQALVNVLPKHAQKERAMHQVLRCFAPSDVLGSIAQQAYIASSCGLAVLYGGVRGYLTRKPSGCYQFSPEDQPEVRHKVKDLSKLSFPEDDVIDDEEDLAA